MNFEITEPFTSEQIDQISGHINGQLEGFMEHNFDAMCTDYWVRDAIQFCKTFEDIDSEKVLEVITQRLSMSFDVGGILEQYKYEIENDSADDYIWQPFEEAEDE